MFVLIAVVAHTHRADIIHKSSLCNEIPHAHRLFIFIILINWIYIEINRKTNE